MPAKLRVAYLALEGPSFPGGDSCVAEGVRCGIGGCGQALGDLVRIRGMLCISLQEGYRRYKDGVYRLHNHSPRDAHGVWVADLFGQDPERFRYREKVKLEELRVTCWKCGFLNCGS